MRVFIGYVSFREGTLLKLSFWHLVPKSMPLTVSPVLPVKPWRISLQLWFFRYENPACVDESLMCQVVSYPTSASGNMISLIVKSAGNPWVQLQKALWKGNPKNCLSPVMYCKLVFASNCQFPRSWHVTIWHLNAAQSAIVYPSRSHSPVAWVAFFSPLGPWEFPC